MIYAGVFLAAFILFGAPDPKDCKKMDTLIEKALYNTGPEYFEAERAVRAAAGSLPIPDASPNTDSLSALILEVLRQWRQPQAGEFEAALEYLDGLPARIAKTPLPSPSPTGISGYLSLHYGWRVADLLAVHLIKQRNWPEWRVSGILLYLRQQARPSTNAALIRFLSESHDEEWTAFALDAIRASKDPDLSGKVYWEQRRAEKEKLPFPETLKSLLKPQ